MGTLMRFLPIITQIFLWAAVFETVGGRDVAGYRYENMVAYYLLTMMSRAFSSMPGLASGVSTQIRNGEIKKFLIQPVDLIGFMLLNRVAHKLTYYMELGVEEDKIVKLVCAEQSGLEDKQVHSALTSHERYTEYRNKMALRKYYNDVDIGSLVHLQQQQEHTESTNDLIAFVANNVNNNNTFMFLNKQTVSYTKRKRYHDMYSFGGCC